MATTKIWPVKDSLKRVTDYAANPEKTEFGDLKDSIEYAANADKTSASDEKTHLVTGINCDAKTAFEDMKAVQKYFGKTSGNVAYHAYQSFKPGEVTADECHEIGVKLARELWGEKFQVMVATHIDKEHLHNHFILNAVSFIDGKKFNDNKAAYTRLRKTSDRLCREHGLSVIEKARGRTPRAIYQAEKRGEATRYNLMRWAIDDAIAVSTEQKSFESALRRLGYVIQVSENRKYPVIRSIHGGKPVRLYHLGEQYDPERIVERVYENDIDVVQRQRKFMVETDNRSPIRKTYVKTNRPKRKLLGHEARYIHCLYLLGYRPKRKNYRPLSPEMRAALRKCDMYSRQAKLLCREHLQTDEDVLRYMDRCEKKIVELSDQRQKIYNKLRRCKDPEKTEKLKEERDKLTSQLKEVRQERKDLIDVLKRSDVLSEDIAREYAAQKRERQRQKNMHRESIRR